jgi:hypothetical protein
MKKRTANLAPNAHEITAKEVLQTSNYTYIRAAEEGNEYWIAIEKTEVKTGETYYWADGAEMKNFYSKELKRSFPSVYFVPNFSEKPILNTAQSPASASMAGKPQPPQKPGITVQPVAGSITIAELYSKKDAYKGRQVKIRGEVVKYSPEIMDRNWVHLQDGTRDGDHYDLTITTRDKVNPGDVVTFSGIITLNKDFGAGYVYEVMMENASMEK